MLRKHASLILVAAVTTAAVVFGSIQQIISHFERHKNVPGSSDGDSPLGFKDYVRNPILFQEMVDDNARYQSRTFSAEQLDELVERLLDPNDREAVTLLRYAGKSAIADLVGALKDQRYHVLEEPSEYLQSSPFARVLNLIFDFRSDEAVPHIAPFVHHKHRHFRSEAAFALANIGNDECIAPVKVSLADNDKHVQAMALNGVGHSLKAKKASEKFREEMFTTISAIVS